MATFARVFLCQGMLGYFIVACLLQVASAQTFQAPNLGIPSERVAGRSLTLSCTCYGIGAPVTLTWIFGPNTISLNTDCSDVGSDIFACTSFYTFTPSVDDNGVSVSCTASQAGNSEVLSDTDIMNIDVEPTSQYPSIRGPDTVDENVLTTWTCVVDGAKPAATLSWRIGATNQITAGTNLPVTSSGGTFNSSNFVRLSFQSGDNGINIRCVMKHSTGDRTTSKTIVVHYRPKVTIPTTTYSTTAGVNVRLQCYVDAVPSATVLWLKGNNSLVRSGGKYTNGNSANPELEINNPTKNDADVYKCTAFNSVGQTYGDPITLNVRYKPEVSIPQNQFEVNVSSSLTLPCNVDANPSVTSVQWKKFVQGVEYGVDLTNTAKFTGGSTSSPSLTINNMQRDDAGSYQCLCFNDIGFGESARVPVTVNYSPINIQINPSSITRRENENVQVTCTAEAVPEPSFTWIFGDVPIANTSKLTITSATRQDDGQYKCIARNLLGSADSVIDISIQYAPVLTSSPSPMAVDEGSTAVLKCTIDSNPGSFTVAWKKDGTDIDRTNSRISGGATVENPDLTISNVQATDAGSYSCTVTHLLGTRTSESVVLSISFSPRNVVISPSGAVINLNEGDSQTLTCSADANPAPTYTWKAGSTVIGSGPTLIISSAGPDDNREVTCEASNSKSTETHSTRINVSYTPRVTIPGGDVYGSDEGDSLTIPCDVDANPKVSTFHWLKNSLVLDLNDASKYGGGTLASHNLTILSLSSTDAGKYSCRAVNDVGEDTSREISVSISYKPTNVELSPSSLNVTEGGPISVTCSAQGAPSPMLQWKKGNQLFPEGPVLNITSAKEEDDGIYTCEASNTKGTSTASLIISVHYVPRVTSPQPLLSGELGDNVVVECQIRAKPEVHSVTWYILNGSSESALDISNSSKYGGGTVSNPSLRIFDLNVDDVGRYRCKGNNSLGVGIGPAVTVLLSFAPRNIVLVPSNVSVEEGERIAVTCSADGAPTPSYVWLRGNDQIANDGILLINSASPEHNGEYTCRASNKEGSEDKVVLINVDYKPRSTATNPVVRTVVGATATLTCSTKANPEVTSYQWSFQGVTLTETGSTLQITPKNDSSFGSYTCYATNAVGTSDPIVIQLQKGTDPGTGESVAAAGLSTPILILIILLFIILIIIVIVILIICYKKGKLCKKKEKSRVQPAEEPANDITPRAEEKPITDAHSGLRSPQWSETSAVSRQHVNLEPSIQYPTKPETLSFENEEKPNGLIVNGALAGGTTISLPEGGTPRPHHLPSLDKPFEESKPKKKKKRKRKKDLENVDEQGE